MSGPSQTISFRMSQAECAELDRLCESLNMRRGDLVRSLVKRRLAEEHESLLAAMQELESEIKRLQINQARGVVLLLNRLGKLTKPEAIEIVRTEFKS
jgi:hypothetical protein